MSFSKVTWLFNHNRYNPNVSTPAQSRASGWSETWYSDYGFNNEVLYTNLGRWATRRAALLGIGASIVGFRVSQVDPTGPTYTRKKLWAGTSGLPADNPEQALVGMFGSENGKNRRQIVLRGVPDERVKYGEYHKTDDFDKALRDFLTEVSTNWKFKGKKHTIAPVQLLGVVGRNPSVIITKDPHGIIAPSYVQIWRTNTPERRQQGIQSVRVTVTDANTLSMASTPARFLEPSEGGQLRRVEGMELIPVFYNSLSLDQLTVGKHDTGRPFFLQRGRRSAKRV
jgi:hypothetical protein